MKCRKCNVKRKKKTESRKRHQSVISRDPGGTGDSITITEQRSIHTCPKCGNVRKTTWG